MATKGKSFYTFKEADEYKKKMKPEYPDARIKLRHYRGRLILRVVLE
jgi:hypothetical protein